MSPPAPLSRREESAKSGGAQDRGAPLPPWKYAITPGVSKRNPAGPPGRTKRTEAEPTRPSLTHALGCLSTLLPRSSPIQREIVRYRLRRKLSIVPLPSPSTCMRQRPRVLVCPAFIWANLTRLLLLLLPSPHVPLRLARYSTVSKKKTKPKTAGTRVF